MTDQGEGRAEEFLRQRDYHERVLKIVEALNGLTVEQAEALLREASRTVAMMFTIDVTGEAYRDLIAQFNRTFGESKSAPLKQ